MKSMLHILSLSTLLMVGMGLSASRLQAQATEDLDKYFDDGGLSTRKNIVSTNLLAPISGNIALRLERRLGKGMSLELGGSYYLYRGFHLFSFHELAPYFEPTGGIGLSVAPHFFFSGHAPEFHYMGPRYAWTRLMMANGLALTMHTVTVQYGYNLFLGKYLMLCYGVGFGLEYGHYSDTAVSVGSYYAGTSYLMPAMDFSVGIGVMF
jgi:hypothetical protein